MKDITKLFARPQELVDWSCEALQEADRTADAFFNETNFPLITEKDAETGDFILKIGQTNPLPAQIARKLTEALNNARNSFDQSLFAACAAIGKPQKVTHYPWAQNPEPDLTRRLVNNKTGKETIPAELWELIRAQEPYPRGDGYSGGEDLIRDMSILANGKHTVGIEVASHVPGYAIPGFSSVGEVRMMFPRWDPVKNEMVIVRSSHPIPEPHTNHRVEFEIRFSRPPPLGRIPTYNAMGAFLEKAQSVLNDFKMRALELNGA